MEYKLNYTTPESRQAIISENATLTLIAEGNITEGNFLIFTDTPIATAIVAAKPSYEELENQLLLMADSQAGGIL